MKKTVLSLAFIATAAMLLTGCETESAPEMQAYTPEVTVAKVITERVTEWDEFTGRIQAPQTVELRPRVSGYIDFVAFEEGAIVEEGEPLFFIENAPFRAEVKRLEAELFDAQSRLSQAEKEFKRAEALLVKNAISQELSDGRFTEKQRAHAQVKAIEAALESARLQLSYTRVEAPISGRISNALITKGNYVQAGQTVLSTLVSTDKVHVYFDADEQTYLKYAELAASGARESSRDVQNPVLMGLANSTDYPYQGVIDFVDNQVNAATGTIRGRAVFDNENGQFIPGLFARIRLLSSATFEGVLIDDRAIGTDLNNKYVLVVNDDNTLAYRQITLGEKIAGLRIVKSGLSGDETIVVNGLQRVRPGAEVNPVSTEMARPETVSAIRETQSLLDRRLLARTTDQHNVIGG